MNKFILVLSFLLVYSSFVSWVSKSYANDSCATVNVKGMVCDFCARGIEKIFKKDINVKKIDVDLSKGQVLIAYPLEAEVDFDDIKQKFLVNGLNATDMKIVNI